MPKRTSYVAPAARSADGQAITTTALCGAHRHQLCPGRILSATAAHGQRCACSCHAAAARPEVEHAGAGA
jgi:hypothetical protein